MKKPALAALGALFAVPTALVVCVHWLAFIAGTEVSGTGAEALTTFAAMGGVMAAVAAFAFAWETRR